MHSRLFVHSVNVHGGGGRSLLLAFLDAIAEECVIAQVDRRMPLPPSLPISLEIRKIAPTLEGRLSSEFWLTRQVGSMDSVLCFGNLPPLFRLRGRVTVLLQNRYLIDRVSLAGFSWKTRLRLIIERYWLKVRISNVDEFVVQTPAMQRLLQRLTTKPVTILPFVAHPGQYSRRRQVTGFQDKKLFDFVYVASGEPHKNHRCLIEAWILLAHENIFPSLRLTVSRADFPTLCDWISSLAAVHQLRIENLQGLSRDSVLTLYDQAGALIYPSTFESFGLPLIEARQAGLPILAGELDYVRDVLDPEDSFDPHSAISIARAVKRHLGIEEEALDLQDAATFLNRLLRKG